MDPITQAKDKFALAKGGLLRALATTPDDRLSWAPSATARSVIQQVAHAAWAITSITETLDGRTFQAESTAAAEASFREWERQFSGREEVEALFIENSAAYEAWLDSLAPERLDETVTMPFGLGTVPLGAVVEVAADHTNWHTAQINYIQTIYGDHDWYLGGR